MKALQLSAELLGFSSSPPERNDLKEAFEREKKDEIDRIKDLHDKELLRIKEEHKEDIIDLQDRVLLWMHSRVDLVQQQKHTILALKAELDSIRCEYNELKETSVETFDQASQSIAVNFSSLKSYVKEELRESEIASKETIENLKLELKHARQHIASLEMVPEDCKVDQPSISSLDSNSARLQQKDTKSDTTWNDFNVKFREAMEGNLPSSNLPPSDASVVSRLDVYDTLKADKLFKDLYSRSSSPLKKKRSARSDDFFDCGQIDEADVFLDCD